MSDMSDLKCVSCGEPLERVRYFPRQLLTADDMRVEQDYFRDKLRRHNRYLHGWGVVCGCTVEAVKDAKAWMIRVCPGYVVGPQGDEILIPDCVEVPLTTGAVPEPCTNRWPCPPVGDMPGATDRPTPVYVAVRYAECFSRPTRVHPAGCGCDESSCEYSRTRDSFEIKVLWKLPESHVTAALDDDLWCETVKTISPMLRRRHRFPVPTCPECVLEPWVVLAKVEIPLGTPVDNATLKISYDDRRTLLATQQLQTALACFTTDAGGPTPVTVDAGVPTAEFMRVRSVEFLYEAGRVDFAIASPRQVTPVVDGLVAIRIKFSAPFSQDQQHKPTTHGMNDANFSVHNVQVVPVPSEVANRGIPYVPGSLAIESDTTIRFTVTRGSPIVDAQGGWPGGQTKYELRLRGNEDLPNNKPALIDQAGNPLDGEPISPIGGVLSGDGKAGGDFLATFSVDTLE